MEYNKLTIKNIFFEYIIKNTREGSIELPIYDEITKTTEMMPFNITLTVNEPLNEFNLNIKDKDKFLNLLYGYVNILCSKGIIKNTNDILYYIALIWCNCTYEDLNNPEKFIQKYIDFENNKLFEDNVFASNIPELLNSNLVVSIKRQNPNYETPYLFNITIKNEDNEYYLPSISYGIQNNCCYIYTIQNKKEFSNNKDYEKKIKRLLYKLNGNVLENESEEYISYKKGSNYYPENISDVSPSAILSLTCFLKLLFEKGITKLKVVPFLPIRYKNKEDFYQKLYAYKAKNTDKNEELLNFLKQEHLRIQTNLTEKLIRSFRRINFHFPNIKILSFPMELDEYMYLDMSEFNLSNNKLLNDCLDSHERINSNFKK